jgi:hypothetical protein
MVARSASGSGTSGASTLTLLARGSSAVIGHPRCCRNRPLAAVRCCVWLLGFLVALTGLSLIDAGEAGPKNNPPAQKQNDRQNDNRQNDRQNDTQNDNRQSDRQNDNRQNDRQNDTQNDSRQSDRQNDNRQNDTQNDRQQGNRNTTENSSQDDDDNSTGNNTKNDPGTARSNRATSTVKAQDTTPPDNLVDWWKWVTGRAAPGPVAKNQGQPRVQNSTAPIPRVAPAPPAKPRAAEPKAPKTAAETPRKEFEPPMGVGASDVDKGPTKNERVRLPDEKTAIGKNAGAAVMGWAPSVPPQPGTYKANEILASNLSPAARERLRQLGYNTQQSSASGLTHIILRDGLDEWVEKRKLETEFQQGFALNFFYEPYRNVDRSTAIEAEVPVRPSVGCSTERCYGRKVIDWKDDRLAACAKDVRVGIIDTAFDASHPAFEKSENKPTIVMAPASSADRALNWHGTGVISLLAGAATSSTPGLIPNATFLIADAFFKDGNRPRTDTAHLVAALRNLEDHKAHIINMSLVGPWDDLVYERIVAMSRKGVVFIAAAGNGGPAAPPGYPAAYPEVIAVTAVDDKGRSYDYANRGRYIDVAAPGVRIWTALPENKEGMVSGTSFAAPFVTAIAAVTYNKSRLKTLIGAGRSQLEPKAIMLSEFAIDSVGSGDSDDRNPIYGLGRVKAPRECGPGVGPLSVATVKDPSVAASVPPAEIKHTSYRLHAAAE